jgi:hypothetical protein
MLQSLYFLPWKAKILLFVLLGHTVYSMVVYCINILEKIAQNDICLCLCSEDIIKESYEELSPNTE